MANGKAITRADHLNQTRSRVTTPDVDGGSLRQTWECLLAGIELVHQLCNSRQASRIGHFGATADNDTAFIVRLRKALGHTRTFLHKLHVGHFSFPAQFPECDRFQELACGAGDPVVSHRTLFDKNLHLSICKGDLGGRLSAIFLGTVFERASKKMNKRAGQDLDTKI